MTPVLSSSTAATECRFNHYGDRCRSLYERFFEEVGKAVDGDGGPLVFEDQPEVGRIVKVAAEYGIEMPGPIT